MGYKGKGKGHKGFKGKAGKSKTKAPKGIGRGEAGQDLGTFVGVLAHYQPRRTGGGFIDCPELAASGFPQLFVEQCQVGEFRRSNAVKFEAFINAQGQPEARNLSHPLAEEVPESVALQVAQMLEKKACHPDQIELRRNLALAQA